MHSVHVDGDRKTVVARLTNVRTPEEVLAFSRDEQAAVRRMGLGDGEFLLLVETEDAFTSPQAVVAAFQEIVLNSPLRAKRIAIVRHGALNTIQTRRIVNLRENAAIFGNVEDARAWLYGDGA